MAPNQWQRLCFSVCIKQRVSTYKLISLTTMAVNPILCNGCLSHTLYPNPHPMYQRLSTGFYTESLRSSSSPRCVPVYVNEMWHTSCLEISIDICVQYRIIFLIIYIKICLHMLAENWSFIYSTYICFPLSTDWCSFEGYIMCCFKLDIADFCAKFVEYKPKTHPTILFCSRNR